MEQPLVEKEVQLEKFPGKGGWTYAPIPEIPQDKKSYFGWKKVKGFIDHVEIRQYHLMPMGNSRLFLPVNAHIRKQIKKKEGDWVKVILYEDNTPTEVPEEFILCLKDDPAAWENFQKFKDGERKRVVDWIYSAKSEELKIERMAEAINKIIKGDRF